MNIHERGNARAEQNQPRTFEGVEDANVRKFLYEISSKIPNLKYFPQADLTHFQYGKVGNGFQRIPTYYELYPLSQKIQRYNVLPYYDGKGEYRSKIYYDREGFLGFASIIWESAEDKFKLMSSGEDTIESIIERLGTDPLAKTIMLPDEHRESRRIPIPNPSLINPKYIAEASRLIPFVRPQDKVPITRETASTYINSLTDEHFEKVKSWTKETITSKKSEIKNDTSVASFRSIPIEVAKMITSVWEVNNGSTEPIETIMDRMTNKDLIRACDTVARYLNEYPNIKNLGTLLRAIQTKLNHDSNNH